jgi:signal peptidase
MTAAVATKPRRTPAGLLGDILLWIASIGGLICILGVIAALGFHITLIMFKTGSMSPTIPTGSLAVVHEIPAPEIRVGDVVTVDRDGQLPVTHRVTSVEGSGETRTITLRGDANPTDDVAPYVVSSVRVVWIAFPGWANVVVWLSNPVVLGALTLSATTLVTWAFWPRVDGHGRRRARRRPTGRAGAIATTGSTLLLSLAIVAGATPDAAQAAEQEVVVHGTYLTLTSVSDPALTSAMVTGTPVLWQVGVEASPPDPGTVHLGIAATAPTPDPGDFSLQIDACPTRWVAGVCDAGSVTWLPATDLVSAVVSTTSLGANEVGSVDSASTVWLMMRVTMTTTVLPQPAQLRLWAWGAGTLSVGGDPLAATGPGALGGWSPMLLAAGALGTGVLLATIASARRRREAGDE